jgi:hypothetical protein
MKKLYSMLFAATIFLYSCNTEPKQQPNQAYAEQTNYIVTDTFKQGFYPNIKGLNVPLNYALYLPVNHKNKPICFFFDPHADGAFPVKKYQSIADSLQCIIVGSHQSKNGMTAQEIALLWQQWYDDVKGRINFDSNNIYVCGFSGGAKAASVAAKAGVNGLICIGAAPFDITALRNSMSYIGITGNSDLNYADVLATDSVVKAREHILLVYDGKHQWCPPEILNTAFCAMLFINTGDSLYKKHYCDQLFKTIEKLLETKQYLLAEFAYNALIMIDNNPTYKDALVRLKQNNQYIQQAVRNQEILKVEQNRKQQYLELLQQGTGVSYWHQQVKLLSQQNVETVQKVSNQRLLNYLSLAIYTLSNKALNNNNLVAAKYFTDVYAIVDKTNAEAYFLSALVAARTGDKGKAYKFLQIAKNTGFTQWNRLNGEPLISDYKLK